MRPPSHTGFSGNQSANTGWRPQGLRGPRGGPGAEMLTRVQRRGFGYAPHSAPKRHWIVFSGCEVTDSVCGKLGKNEEKREEP